MSGDARRPVLARRARFRWDAAREQHVVVVPEGVLTLTEEGAEITALIDARRSFAALIVAVAPAHPEAAHAALGIDAREYRQGLAARAPPT